MLINSMQGRKMFTSSKKKANNLQNLEIEKKGRIFIWLSYAYILLPFLVFAIGWFGKRFWIPMVPILLFCYWKAGKDTDALWIPPLNKENLVKIAFILFIIFVWVYYSGVGRMIYQNTDHNCRNAIYEILVKWDWPVYNFDINVEIWGGDTTATSLVYYIGFWLPSAVVGKIFGVDVGYGFQVFWAVLGIALVYYFICARKKRILVWPLAIVIFFSGLDIVGQFLNGQNLFSMANDMHIEWWTEPYQFSSMTTQLFWVFNQSIPAWLCTVLAFTQKNNRSMIFILACCMLPGTLPFVGLLILVLFWTFTRKYDVEGGHSFKTKVTKYIHAWIVDTCTLQNVLGGGIVGIFSFLYLSSNLSGQQFMVKSVLGPSYDNHLAKYLMFMLVEVGVYFIILYKYQKRNGLFYVIVASLIIIPPIKVGIAGDFCMRASIPALFILMIMVMDALEKAKQKRDLLILVSLIVALTIGGITPLHEIARTFKNTKERLSVGKQLYETSADSFSMFNSGNFSGSVNDSFFYKYIVR